MCKTKTRAITLDLRLYVHAWVCQCETQMHIHCANCVSLHFVCFFLFLFFHFLVTFSVMCYNVLCDKYCTRQIYGYCPSWALDWEYRKTAILKEILHYGADILGLQVMCKHSFCRNCFVFLTFISNTQYIYFINQLNQAQVS